MSCFHRVNSASSTDAGQPITGKLVGGAILSLRDKEHPWPVDLAIANGATHVTVKGTLQDPMALAGADVMTILLYLNLARWVLG